MATRIHKRKGKNAFIVYFINPISREKNQIGNFTNIEKSY